jgi:hypothetical protein
VEEDRPEEVAAGRTGRLAEGTGLVAELRTVPGEADRIVRPEAHRTGPGEVAVRSLAEADHTDQEEAAVHNLEEHHSRLGQDCWISRPWSRSSGR